MADDDSFWSGVVVAAAIAGTLYYCTRDEEKAPDILTLTPPGSYASTAVDVPTKPNEMKEPPPPPRNYVAEENGVYFYETAVSEEDQKKGRATGDIIGFSYIGQNSAGRYVLRIYSETGNEIGVAGCSNPCQLIRHEDGRRTAFNPNSVIGSAFLDTFRGHLKQVKPKLEKSNMNAGSAENDSTVPSSTDQEGWHYEDGPAGESGETGS